MRRIFGYYNMSSAGRCKVSGCLFFCGPYKNCSLWNFVRYFLRCNKGVVTIIAHGFSSSAIFCIAYFSYEKRHTRNIPYIKGVLQVYPALRIFWFIFCCINMACPPTLNLIGEMAIIPPL